jgi:small GTP-binding protein
MSLFCKCVVLGDGGIGKTCLLYSYLHDLEFLAAKEEYVQTIFENYQAETTIQRYPGCDDAFPITLTLWDTAGQEQYDELRRM